MLLGQSVFQSVLTRLKQEGHDEKDEEPAESFRVTGLGVVFVASDLVAPDKAGLPETETATNAHIGAQAYFDFLPEHGEIAPEPRREPEPEEPPPAPVMPPHLLRLTEQEIAEELAIGPKDSDAILAEKRRRFAKLNHPDGVAPEFRENAAIRMTTANLLIDRAIRNSFWR